LSESDGLYTQATDLIEGLLVNASIREAGVIRRQAVLVPSASTGMAGAACWRWRWPTMKARPVGTSSWRNCGNVDFAACSLWLVNDHSGLRKAIREVLAQALWQRCYVHFLHNALDCLPRRADDIPRMGHDIPTSLAKTIADAIGAAASRRK
jgi:hypothetical protein